MEGTMEKKSKIRLFMTVLLIAALLVPVLYFLHIELDIWSYFRSLPKDEEMIARFREHREDFEKLVSIYKSDPSVRMEGLCLAVTPDVEIIVKRAGVSRICTEGYFWSQPDPYSEEARKKSISKYPLFVPRQASGIIFNTRDKTVRIGTDKINRVDKSYYYTPVVPTIEKGLRYPAYELLRTPFTDSGYIEA